MQKNTRLLLLDKDQVAALLSLEDVLGAVRESFILHSEGEGRLFPVVREKLATGAIFGIKSGDIGQQGLLGFKSAGFWPGNRAHGSEPHQATILLFDPETGRPRCLIDGNIVTTLRTGAAGGLGLLTLARPDSSRLCVFGTGVQARIQARFALRCLPGLRSIRYLSSRGTPDAVFEAELRASAGGSACAISHVRDGDAAVAESDVVITATPGKGPLFNADAVQPGTHLNCVGADTEGKRELPDGVLAGARLFVDDLTQARQIGESQWSPESPCTALGDLLSGKHCFERQPSDTTVFDMTGIALQDLTVAGLLLQKAQTTGVGTTVDWPW